MTATFQGETIDAWNRTRNQIKNKINVNETFIIDPKRNVNKNEKQSIWNNSNKHELLDPDVFRIDVLGNVIIKSIKYEKCNSNRIFAGEYEHLVSHSHGGQSDTQNVCLLNAGINRSKSNSELYTLKYNEMLGLCSRYGMSARVLLEKLRYDQEDFCNEYNLYFEKINGIWTTKVHNKYNGEIRTKKENRRKEEKAERRTREEKRSNREQQINIEHFVAGAVIILVIENHEVIYNTISSAWNNTYNFFFGETKEEIKEIQY
jgi:hypothetical protein